MLLILQVYQASSTGLPATGVFYPPTLITGVHTVSDVVVEEVHQLTVLSGDNNNFCYTFSFHWLLLILLALITVLVKQKIPGYF